MPCLVELAQELERDVRDDLDVHPGVVVDLHPGDGVHVRDVPPGLELVVAVDAADHAAELLVAADGHVDPHPRDRLGGRQPGLALGLRRDRVDDVVDLELGSSRLHGRSIRPDRLRRLRPMCHKSGMHEQHPVGLVVDDDLRRSRLTVFFRLLLAIPHLVWFVALVDRSCSSLAIVGWIVGARHRAGCPGGLHRFFCAYIRYVDAPRSAYFCARREPVPAVHGRPLDGYPLDVRLPDSRSRSARLAVLVPAHPRDPGAARSRHAHRRRRHRLVSRAGTGTPARRQRQRRARSPSAAFLGWFASLVAGRMPRGLRDAGAYCARLPGPGRSRTSCSSPTRYPNADPHAMLAELEPPPPHPVHLDGDSARSPPLARHRLLPAAAR